MKKHKHRKIRAAVRWMVWVCTGLIVIAVVASNWIGMFGMVSYEYADEDQTMVWVDLEAYGMRMSLEYRPRQRQHWGGERNPGWGVEVIHNEFPSELSDQRWWSGVRRWQGGGGFGGFRGWEVPLVYPAMVMVAWSVWLMRGRRKLRLRVGCCTECGYSLEGLTNATCPECGGIINTSA